MSLVNSDSVVILGAGQAGVQAASSLRRRGYRGKLALIGEESHPPYQRPPLSKTCLKGMPPAERLFLKPREYYAEMGISLALGVQVEGLDRKAGRLAVSGGRPIPYSHLIMATGASPRRLALLGSGLDGVVALRRLDDARALRRRLQRARRLVVVGGGYIGLEVAASARSMGVDVVVLERAPRLLARSVGPDVSDFFSGLHKKHGVSVQCDAALAEIVGHDGAVVGVRMDDGSTIDADAVLAGVGVTPATELAAEAGLACNDGVLVDAECRTSDHAIFAVGDCARRPWTGEPATVRLESVHNAIGMGERAAAALMGDPSPPAEPPWFWSDQYDVKLQTVGLSAGFDEVIRRDDSDFGGFSAFYLRRGRLIAVEAVNAPSAFVAGKALLRAGAAVEPRVLADPSASLKSILSRYAATKATV